MYRLDVFHPGNPVVTESVSLRSAIDAVAEISRLLKKHQTCERIVLFHQGAQLFAVDCQGDTIHP